MHKNDNEGKKSLFWSPELPGKHVNFLQITIVFYRKVHKANFKLAPCESNRVFSYIAP